MSDAAALVREVLRALADLAPSGERTDAPLSVPTEWFSWLPVSGVALLGADDAPRVSIDEQVAERLAAVAQIRATAGNTLRVGWLFVVGRTTVGRTTRKVLHPLVTMPVRVRRTPLQRPWLEPAGDPELSPRIAEGPERRRLEDSLDLDLRGVLGAVDGRVPPAAALAALPRLEEWAREAARIAGFEVTRLLTAEDPAEPRRGHGLAVAPSMAVYAAEDVAVTSRAASLRAWAERRGLEATAFAAVYDGPVAMPEPTGSGAPESPFLLTATQRRAVLASRAEPVSVVSGAPGTGKSQTVVAIACDALARGETVLVAARSDAAVDALLDLIERTPGPEPVVFGSSERRHALAQRLAAGLDEVPHGKVVTTAHALAAAVGHRDARRRALADWVRAHQLVAGDPALVAYRDAAPALFAPGADLPAFDKHLGRAGNDGWWARRAASKARAAAGAAPDLPLEVLAAARELARVVSAAAVVAGGAPLVPTGDYAALAAASDVVRESAGRWLAAYAHSEKRVDSRARASVAGLATALRSGRAQRRTQLARLDRPLIHALPIWVGSLPDIDDLLPQVAGLFDLVVLDEASSIDQPLAAPALLRARRAVVVGDPKQLRHVSFLGDEELRSVLDAHGLHEHPLLASRLDVRRNSTFDVAASAAPVLTLDEHHRSRPHLVHLVARRVYGGSFAVAKRTPETESLDCIHAERLAGERNKVGSVLAEVDRVVELLRERLAAGATGIGVVTPFRTQADALEAAALAAFTADELQALNLRVGTVHAFQGNERDEVLVSLGIGPAEKATTWRFVEDPHLFAVLTTRARTDTTVLHSADPPPRGLMAAYLAEANRPPGRPKDAPVPEWAAAVARELRTAGADVVTGYPAGRHTVDVCCYGFPQPVAVVCEVHPDGADAHVERGEALVRGGWRVVEALRRPMATPERVAVELLTALRGLA